ncbi:hypothetical protein SAMN02745166_04243 [Prosthecobacter debontii]|uniref:Uncharacterized protein n=1 Tax=Prosthecobacter debontii TaxID=48467 RepID=A0A1T4YUF7_9BACT|nr:hypothetical protein [Prosthecobacter debontii]SKB05356.1 hypothetical protein SAMN02745166_04243 [Prosthecobacter debontii]
MKKLLILALLPVFTSALPAWGEPPKTEHKDWEKACGGSQITITRVGDHMVTLEAFAEHFAEGRQWQCHFQDGQIISAAYRHFIVTRKNAGDAGEFTTEQIEDRVEVFHFPDHDFTQLDPALKKDLSELLALAQS